LQKPGGKWAKVPLNARIILENDPEVKGVLRFNVFRHQIETAKAPAWDKRKFTEHRLIDHFDTILIQDWLQKKYKLALGTTQINDAATNAALNNKIDPPADYLKECHAKWIVAGRPSLLETVDQTCFKHAVKQMSADDKRNMVLDIFVKFMISLVARIMSPGCKSDMMLILVGNENIGKSKFFEIIASEAWFTDSMPPISKRDDFTRHMTGKLIGEWSELKTLIQTQEEEYKSFLSCRVDTFTQKMGKMAQGLSKAMDYWWQCEQGQGTGVERWREPPDDIHRMRWPD
jgi:putative DNA primase/helicase